MRFVTLRRFAMLALLTACTSAPAHAETPARAESGLDPVAVMARAERAAAIDAAKPTPASSAGDLPTTARPDRSDAEIAALRAKGPSALPPLLAALARTPAGPARDALAATIDRVAAQRYATVSRLYWYTDLEAAAAEAKRTGKPILSLRMLGRLDEDLSCANSRLFRTILYANEQVSKLLRDRFVLHWSSERAVPRVTIDFGDGRRLERTVTGNSAHYLLDADLRVLDALPGMYAPSVFRAELARGLALASSVATLDDRARSRALGAWHRARAEALHQDWVRVGRVPVMPSANGLLELGSVRAALAKAQGATVSKALIEVPDLRIIDVGADPGPDADVPTWASIGQRLFGIGGLPVIDRQGRPRPVDMLFIGTPARVLDRQAEVLVRSLITAPAETDRTEVLRLLERAVVADTALNEMRLHRAIHERMSSDGRISFDAVNRWIYADVFHTPAEDAWLGLLPRTAYTGLPGDGVVATAR